jgi:hypothetical protein
MKKVMPVRNKARCEGIKSIAVVLYLLAFLFIFFGSGCVSKDVTQKRQGSGPFWLSGQPGYLIVSGDDFQDVNKAGEQALERLRAQISESVATEIWTKRMYYVEERNQDKRYETFSSFVRETIAKTPSRMIVRGVSMSNVTDHHVERLRDAETGNFFYRYHIKYPYNRSDIETLLREVEAKQLELLNNKQEIADRLGKHETVEQLVGDIYLLHLFKDLLDPTYMVDLETLIVAYFNFLNTIHIRVADEGEGYIRFGLYNNKKVLRLGSRPVVEGEDILVQRVYHDGDHWVADFRELSPPSHKLPKLRLSLKYKNFEREYLHLVEPKVEVDLLSPILLVGKEGNFWGTEIRAFDLHVPLQCHGLGGAAIMKLVLQISRIGDGQVVSLPPLTIELNGQHQAATGSSVIMVHLKQRLDKKAFSYQQGGRFIAEGFVYYKEIITGEQKMRSFSGIELRTDW